MLRRNKKFITTMALTLGILFTGVLGSVKENTVFAASSRLWGQDRYETSSAISKEGWTTSEYVVIASGEGYADALCAAPLAKKYNAPILLTGSENLNSKIKNEIKRLNAKHVFIIGKYASISESAETELKTIVGDVKRLGGQDRYETSVIVAKELGSIDKVVITSGYGFADALSIAPIAAAQNMPILLTGKEELPQTVQKYIGENKSSIKNTYVVGGQGVINDKAVEAISGDKVRLSGANRFETNLNVMKHFQKNFKFDNVYVVQGDGPTGKEFADALSGSALAVKTSSPIILTYNSVSEGIQQFLKENVKSNGKIIALGGSGAVPQTVISAIEKATSQEKPTNPVEPQPTVPGGGGAVGGGGATTPSKPLDSTTKEKLTSIKSNIGQAKKELTGNQKTIIEKIEGSITNILNNSSYDFKSDANEVKALYKKLSAKEAENFQNVVTKYVRISELYYLKDKFGL